MTLTDFTASIIAYCDATTASVTSWGRTEKHNRAVGGAPLSAHRWWLAADVVYDETPSLATAVQLARAYNLRLTREEDHDHLQDADYRPPRVADPEPIRG